MNPEYFNTPFKKVNKLENRTTTRVLSYTSCFIMIVLLSCVSCSKEELQPDKIEKIELNTSSRLNRIQYINDSVCIVGGGERFLKTEIISTQNAGAIWNAQSYPEAGKAMYALGASKDGTTYLCGIDGKLLATNDMGSTWAFHQLTYWWFYNGLAFTTDKKCILISTAGQTYGTIVRIDSNYNTIDTTNIKFGLNDIAMPTETTGYVAGFGSVLKTTDGGSTWQPLSVKNDNFISLHCNNDQELWVCGYRGSIFHSSNGGSSWDKQRNGNALIQKNYLFLDIYFKDKDTGWVCGENGLLIYTRDGGNTWKEYKKFTDNALRDMTLAPDGRLLLVGDNGAMYSLNIN